MKNRTLNRYEPLFFFIELLIHLFPFFIVHYFLTVDGPAHLYNANLIHNYFAGSSEFISRYFYLNPNPEPNWTGHAIMGSLLFFLPAFLTEKLFISLYIISMAWSFRKLILVINPQAAWATFLIFPFLFNLPFSFGFYNFSIGIPVLFFGIYFWIKKEQFKIKDSLLFFSILVLAYFSHIIICLMLIGICGSMLLVGIFLGIGSWKDRFLTYKSKVITLFIGMLPVLLLVLHFIQVKGTGGYKGAVSSLPWNELFEYVLDTRSVICWIYDTEQAISIFLTGTFMVMIGCVVYIRMKAKEGLTRSGDYWLGFSLFFLLLFFFIPDSVMSGGFISVRILLLFHLFLLIWLGIQEFSDKLRIFFSAAFLAVSLNLMSIHMTISANLDKDVREYLEIAALIPERSNLLPLNYGDNWLHLNLSNYAGAKRNIVVLDNYEGNYPQFPLRWQEKAYPYTLIGSYASSKRPCISLDAYEKKSGLRVQFLSRWQHSPEYKDSCTLITNKLIHEQFELVYQSSRKHAELFKRKKP